MQEIIQSDGQCLDPQAAKQGAESPPVPEVLLLIWSLISFWTALSK